MFRRALRTVLVSSFALVLWTLARPAHAMPVPLCDDRGATAIAPPVALEAPAAPARAIARPHAPLSCPGNDSPFGASIGRGHRTGSPVVTASEPVVPASQTAILPAPVELSDPPPLVMSPAEGVRIRVERPPRG